MGFEGGQMPLYRRLPKRGFKNRNSKEIVGINVDALNRYEDGAVVTVETMIETGLVSNPRDGVKILGNGEATKKKLQKNINKCLKMNKLFHLPLFFLAESICFYSEFFGDFTVSKDFYAISRIGNKTSLNHSFYGYNSSVLITIQSIYIDSNDFLGVSVFETSLRKTSV